MPDANPPAKERLTSVDLLRGLVMVLMALDHARDYFGDFSVDPTDLSSASAGLFFTRWITHFCAPVFVFLAGVAAFLYGAKERSTGDVARFLLSRGLWLIVLELTLIRFVWIGPFSTNLWFIQVIAAIGVAMVALGPLVFLPRAALVAVGLALVLGHNLFDGVVPADFGAQGWLWRLAHEGGFLPPFRGELVLVVYPLVPWIGVLALGYALGPWLLLERAARRRRLALLGALLTLAFVLVRATHAYGDPLDWRTQATPLLTLASFLNCQKYPPSLHYLLMTLGPALVFLALADRPPGRLGRALVTFGRVPLFYYVAHLALIHAAAYVFHTFTLGEPFSSIGQGLPGLLAGQPLPEAYGAPLSTVYLSWALVVLALFPVCAAYARLKARGRSPLWSYL